MFSVLVVGCKVVAHRQSALQFSVIGSVHSAVLFHGTVKIPEGCKSEIGESFEPVLGHSSYTVVTVIIIC